MNVLLVGTNRCREPFPVVPLGACLVAEAADRAGHQVRLLDLMFAVEPEKELGRVLREFGPQVVGLSVRNLDNTTMAASENYLPQLLPLIRTIRAWGDPELVIGGAAAGIAPEQLLRFTGAGWCVSGPGEATFTRLLASFSAGRHAEDIPGLARLEGDRFRFNSPDWPQNHHFQFPDIGRWIDLRLYRQQGSTIPLQSKRGCSFACSYCPCPQIEGADYRLAPPTLVADEIRRLAAAGIRDIEFIDTVFNAPYGHALDICRELARNRPPARLHTYELNPGMVDDTLLAAMEEAGFAAVGLTAESADADVLSGLGKNYQPHHLYCAAKALRRSRLPCLWIYMLGGPGETAASAAETLRFARSQLGPRDVAFFTVGVRIYPGTGLERQAIDEGLLAPGANLLVPTFYQSPQVDAGRLQGMVREAVIAEPRFVSFGMNSLRMLPLVRGLVGRLGLAPPLWRHTARIRRGLALLGIRER